LAKIQPITIDNNIWSCLISEVNED